MQTKSTHERRQHAAQVATVVTSLVFVGWIATLGVRLANHQTDIANSLNKTSNELQLANAINGMGTDVQQNNNSLEVATTTTYTGVPGQDQTTLPQQ